jgi:hypothetical protein
MRACVVFRGENFRTHRGRTSALDHIANWKKTIFDVIDCDVVFITYPSNILDELVEKLSPVYVCVEGYNSQETNASAAIDWMSQNKNNYDRFVLLRFDIMYHKKITDWPYWNNKGIILVNKDVHYPTARLYADIVFVIDKEWVDQFKDAFVARGKQKCCLHHIGKYLEEMDVPFLLMYQDYYHMTNHPLHSLCPTEPEPDPDQDYLGEKVLDVSQWN